MRLAIVDQFSATDTLVPPNFITTHLELATSGGDPS
jgi:hypothetical protein